MEERGIKVVGIVVFNRSRWVNYDAIYKMKKAVEGSGLGAEIRSSVSHILSRGCLLNFQEDIPRW